MEKLLKTILAEVRKKPFSYQALEDLHYMAKEAMKEDIALGVRSEEHTSELQSR